MQSPVFPCPPAYTQDDPPEPPDIGAELQNTLEHMLTFRATMPPMHAPTCLHAPMPTCRLVSGTPP